MEKEIMGPESDGRINKEFAEMYEEILIKIIDICDEAHALLHLFDINRDCACTIMETYLEKIDELIHNY